MYKRQEGKIPSDKAKISLELRRNPKLIDHLKARLVVGFKALARISDEELVRESLMLIKRTRCALVVANKIEHVKPGKTRVVLVERNGDAEDLEGTKHQVADKILDKVVRMM